MDILFFLKERTRLIRQYYVQASSPFSEIIRKIEAGEEPYIQPYSEDPEPAYMTEWIESHELLEVTGRCCVSMLSAALQLYFKTWERDLGLACNARYKSVFKNRGLVGGYQACFAEQLGINWDECPADLAIIEQIVLARNRDQHPESIMTLRVTHTDNDLARYPQPFFLNDKEAALFTDGDAFTMWMSPTLHVPQAKVMAAINSVELLCEWLEEKMSLTKYPKRHGGLSTQGDECTTGLDGGKLPT